MHAGVGDAEENTFGLGLGTLVLMSRWWAKTNWMFQMWHCDRWWELASKYLRKSRNVNLRKPGRPVNLVKSISISSDRSRIVGVG